MNTLREAFQRKCEWRFRVFRNDITQALKRLQSVQNRVAILRNLGLEPTVFREHFFVPTNFTSFVFCTFFTLST